MGAKPSLYEKASAPALLPLPRPHTVLQASAGGAHLARCAEAMQTVMTLPYEKNVTYALPTERRYVELGVSEFDDASKLVANFELTRGALGVASGLPFRVMTLTLVCEQPKPLGLCETLDWVETAAREGGTDFRVHGDAVEALLVGTGAARMLTEVRADGALVHALQLPSACCEMMMWSRLADESSFSARVAKKDTATRVRIIAELLVGAAGSNAVVHSSMRHSARIFRAPVLPGRLEIDVALLLPRRGMLRMLTAAVPRQLGAVVRIALTLDGHELVGAPGIAAALAAKDFVGGEQPGQRLEESNSHQHLLLKLSAYPQHRCSTGVTISGELHLDAPAVRAGGLLALRVTLACAASALAAADPARAHVHVQADTMAVTSEPHRCGRPTSSRA